MNEADQPGRGGATGDRIMRSEIVRALAVFLLVFYAARIGLDIANTFIGTGKPIFADFVSFWTAASSAVQGDSLLPYHFDGFSAQQKALFGWDKFAFFYPPVWLLYLLPLGLMPYMVAAMVFAFGTASLAAWAMGALLRSRQVMLFVLVWPGITFAMLHGQNSNLNLALMAGFLAALDRRREVLAGVLISLMAYKPHFGLLVPLALLAGGHWRAIGAATLTVLATGFASLAVFGAGTWAAFLAQAPEANRWLVEAVVPISKFASLFALARQMDLPLSVAFVLQAVLALGAVAAVVLVWRHPYEAGLRGLLRGAVLVSATCVTTPFILDYDLALLALPVAVLVQLGLSRGFCAHEVPVLALAFALMFFTSGWGVALDHSASALPGLLVFALCLYRAKMHAEGGRVPD